MHLNLTSFLECPLVPMLLSAKVKNNGVGSVQLSMTRRKTAKEYEQAKKFQNAFLEMLTLLLSSGKWHLVSGCLAGTIVAYGMRIFSFR